MTMLRVLMLMMMMTHSVITMMAIAMARVIAYGDNDDDNAAYDNGDDDT